VSPVHQYKSVENKIFKGLSGWFRGIFSAIAKFFQKIVSGGRQRFTIMLIPHSEKRIFHFKISVFTLIFLGAIIGGIVSGFFFYSTHITGVSNQLESVTEYANLKTADIALLQDAIAGLNISARKFEDTLNEGLVILGGSPIRNDINNSEAGNDLSQFQGSTDEGVERNYNQVRNITELMNNARDGFSTTVDLNQDLAEIMRKLPIIWPTSKSSTYVTQQFGPSMHPFDKWWYIHTGLDLGSGGRIGLDVYATADGEVSRIERRNTGYGNMIVIKHQGGYYTLYAHLHSIKVDEGDTVAQGQVIGLLGNSGLSTGPHLHYEIRVGTQVINPISFLKLGIERRN
jgi:murein DD-endopeptidase MepM/ murein hydrolase activator NlpD